jgi:CubicO group peptidase (beta-lactamase class C family)
MNKTTLLIHLVLVAGILATGANAKPANQEKLVKKYDFTKTAAFIESQITKGIIPGASLVVEHHGKTVLRQNWGTYCSSTRRDTPVEDGVSNMLYSVSKGISATVIVMAHEKGLIEYDAPLSKYIPEYKGKWKDTCTIRHLLTHSAGIPNCTLKSVYTPEQWKEAVTTLCNYEVEWEPGSRTAYHGLTGVFLAAEAVRRASGLPTWEAVCRKFLFDPIGAKSLTFMIPENTPIALTPQPGAVPCAVDPGNYGLLGHPAGGCFGKVEDVLKVLRLNLNEGVYNGKRLISKKEMQEMHRVQYEKQIAEAESKGVAPTHEPWGLGWLIKRNLKDHWFGFGEKTSPRTFGHAGIDTVLTVAEPESDFALVFLTTNSPKSPEGNTVLIRNTVTDLVTEAIDKAAK